MAATTIARYLSPTNTHLPVATGIVVGFVRDPKEFAFNRYVQLVETKSVNGMYYTVDSDHPVRVRKRSEYVWESGADAPLGTVNLGAFKMDDFVCEQMAFPFQLGEIAVEQAQEFAGWDPLTYEARAMASQAMTLRTIDVWSSEGTLNLDAQATWPTANTDTVASLSGVGGGTWTDSTPANQVIKKSLWGAIRLIMKATNNAVKPSDMICVISPADAIEIAAAPEIVDFVKQQASSPDLLQNNWQSNVNSAWLLPKKLYGIELVVEDAPYVTSLPIEGGFATTPGTRAYAKADGNAVLMSRVGTIAAPYGAKSFSTVQCYWHKYDMAVEAMHDVWNKNHKGRVIDYRRMVAPALVSGFNLRGIS